MEWVILGVIVFVLVYDPVSVLAGSALGRFLQRD